MVKRKKLNIRVGYETFKAYLIQLVYGENPNLEEITQRTASHCNALAKTLGFMEEEDTPSLTNRGQDMIEAYTNHDRTLEERILREALKENDDFRLHWAFVSDRRREFKISDVVPAFRKAGGYTNVEDASLTVYTRSFVNWARASRLCERVSTGSHTHRILEWMPIGIKYESLESGTIVSTEIDVVVNPEMDLHFSVYKLNTYICDYLSNPAHEADLNLIQGELDYIKEHGRMDDLVIEMLEREIATALTTKSPEDFTMVALSLKSLRDRHVEDRVVTDASG